MVKVIGRQLDRCDVCGRKTHKIDLVRTNVAFLGAAGSNYFEHSSYNTDFWTLLGDSSDAGLISAGPYADRSRIVVGDDNSRTESFGSQTWTIGSAIGDYSGFFYMRSNPVDMSSWSSFTVSFDFGYQEQDTSNKRVMVYAYVKDAASGGNSSSVQKRFQGTYSSGRYWWNYNISDLPAGFDASTSYFFIVFATYTGGEKIWVDRLQLEKNASKMGTFVPTSGSTIDRTDTAMMSVRKVCSNCLEPLLSKTEQYNRNSEQRTDEPISVDIQEI